MSSQNESGNQDLAVSNPFGSKKEVQGASVQALVQREVAEVQGAMVVARQFPRNPQRAMDAILNECTRVGLAEKAEYQYARGGSDIRGPSIRLAETIARQWGNMLTGVTELTRGVGVSECMAYAWDLETGYRDEKRFQVKHVREKRSGNQPITSEREIYEHVANLGARRKRACILAVVPSDVVEAALEQCELTLRTKIEINDELIKSLVDKFASVDVTRVMLEQNIQRNIDRITPALVVRLGRIYNSIKDGLSLPRDWFEVATDDERASPHGATAKLDKLAGPDKLGGPTNGNGKQEDLGKPPNMTQLKKAIKAATTVDEVNLQLDLARHLSIDHQEKVLTAANARIGELTKDAQGGPSEASQIAAGDDGGGLFGD